MPSPINQNAAVTAASYTPPAPQPPRPSGEGAGKAELLAVQRASAIAGATQSAEQRAPSPRGSAVDASFKQDPRKEEGGRDDQSSSDKPKGPAGRRVNVRA